MSIADTSLHQTTSERKSALLWATFIFGLIGINLSIAGYALAVAVADQSFRPLPNYSTQAVDWQIQKELISRSNQLGWNVQFEHSDSPNQIRIMIADIDGRPVTGVTGALMAFHFTRVAEHRKVPIIESSQEQGVYFAQIPIDREGKWQVSIDVMGPQGQQYVADRTVDWSFR
ncbi:MAG: FixH family protein [Planctomycetota bacterium]